MCAHVHACTCMHTHTTDMEIAETIHWALIIDEVFKVMKRRYKYLGHLGT